MNNEQLFMFNPFNIGSAKVSELRETFNNLHAELTHDQDVPFMIMKDVEIYSNLYFIVGELVARYQKDYDDLKVKIDTLYDVEVYKQRDIWLRENEGKAPAMSYFQGKAREIVLEDTLILNNFRLDLKRAKYMLDAIEIKINAKKKMYDAVKHHIGILDG